MSKKDTIYIDVEDDITTVINKATSADKSLVALVLPKRFATLQSSVNMKLLNKAAKDNKKSIVLITTESALLPLAAAAKLHVAKSLNSRPEIPKIDAADLKADAYGEDPIIDETATLDDLASSPLKDGESKDTKDPGAKKSESKKISSDRRKLLDRIKWQGKLKVPNFGRFRNRMILGSVGVIIFVVGYIFAFVILPAASIAITAETSSLPTSFNFSASLKAEADDIEAGLLKAEVKEVKKTVSQTFQATGEKDVGQKASGAMTVQNCDSSNTLSVEAGTVFTDETSGFSFVSTEDVSVPGGDFSGGGCSSPGEANVNVQAQESGDTKNLSPRGYFVQGFSQFVTGFGAQMSGGTSQIVKIVTQDDIDKASKSLLNRSDDEVLIELTGAFGDGLIVLAETFTQSASDPSSDPAVGEETNEGRVTAEFTYSIVAVSHEGLTALVENRQQERIETGDQSILNNGVDNAVIELIENEKGVFKLSLETEAIIGPDLDLTALAQEVSGKRYSEVVSIIENKNGVKEVTVEFSPPWIFSAPRSEKITISIDINDTLGATTEQEDQ